LSSLLELAMSNLKVFGNLRFPACDNKFIALRNLLKAKSPAYKTKVIFWLLKKRINCSFIKLVKVSYNYN
jgi:hypothetical protein